VEKASEGSSTTARLLMALAVVLTLLGVATARVVVAGEHELALSNEALEFKDPRAAIVHARRAAGWYAPGAPHVSVALTRLLALAEAAEQNRQDELALLAWRGLRQAAMTTRWVLTPHAEERDRAEKEIARLSAKRPRQAEPNPAEVTVRFRELAERPGQHPAWGLVLVGSFGLSAAGFAWWSRSVAGAGGRLDLRAARGGLVLTLIGVASWLLTVWRS